MKHAYLIMAHNEFEVLQKLIDAIDDARNDIYIHIDKKVKIIPTFHCSRSQLYVLDDSERVKVFWGTSTQIKAELSLFRKSYNQGAYSYYHIISGVHLPLKSQDFLHEFYGSCYDKQILHVLETPKQATDFKLRRYHYFVRYFRNRHKWVCNVGLFMSNLTLFFQKGIGLFRKERQYAKSENWLSLTGKAVAYLIQNERRIMNEYRYTFCADEYFVATELCRNHTKFKVLDVKNLLLTDFRGPSPRIYDSEDFVYLVSSGYLFARKFSAMHMEVVNKIVKYVTNKR